jgi:stress-induced morphogen
MAAATEHPVEAMIVERITAAFSPIHLEVVNESYKHSVPKGSETHFKVRAFLCGGQNSPTLSP